MYRKHQRIIATGLLCLHLLTITSCSNYQQPSQEEVPNRSLELVAKGGHQVAIEDLHAPMATVAIHVPGAAQAQVVALPLDISPQINVHQLAKSTPAYQENRVSVCLPAMDPQGKGYVHIAGYGLPGGAYDEKVGCKYADNEMRRDPDNPNRWVCPGNGKHPRTPQNSKPPIPSAPKPSTSSSHPQPSKIPTPAASNSSTSNRESFHEWEIESVPALRAMKQALEERQARAEVHMRFMTDPEVLRRTIDEENKRRIAESDALNREIDAENRRRMEENERIEESNRRHIAEVEAYNRRIGAINGWNNQVDEKIEGIKQSIVDKYKRQFLNDGFNESEQKAFVADLQLVIDQVKEQEKNFKDEKGQFVQHHTETSDRLLEAYQEVIKENNRCEAERNRKKVLHAKAEQFVKPGLPKVFEFMTNQGIKYVEEHKEKLSKELGLPIATYEVGIQPISDQPATLEELCAVFKDDGTISIAAFLKSMHVVIRLAGGGKQVNIGFGCEQVQPLLKIADVDLENYKFFMVKLVEELDASRAPLHQLEKEGTDIAGIVKTWVQVKQKLDGLIERLQGYETDQDKNKDLARLFDLSQKATEQLKKERHRLLIQDTRKEISREGFKTAELERFGKDPQATIVEATRFKEKLKEMIERIRKEAPDPEESIEDIQGVIQQVEEVINNQRTLLNSTAPRKALSSVTNPPPVPFDTKVADVDVQVALRQKREAALEQCRQASEFRYASAIDEKNMVSQIDFKHLPSSQVLAVEAKAYLEACQKDIIFQKLRSAWRGAEAQLNKGPASSFLRARREEAYAALVKNELSKQCIRIGLQAQALRDPVAHKATVAKICSLGADLAEDFITVTCEKEIQELVARVALSSQTVQVANQPSVRSRQELEEAWKQLLCICAADAEFNMKRRVLQEVEEQLSLDPYNEELQVLREEKLAILQNDPLGQQAMELGLEAAFLRKQVTEEALFDRQVASDPFTPPVEAAKYDEQYVLQCKEAWAIRDNVIQKVRGLFFAPPTPIGPWRAWAGVKGLLASFYDLGKGLVVDLPVLIGGTVLEAVTNTPEWQAKLQDKWNNLGEFCETLFDQTKQSWEDPEAYNTRMQAAREIQDRYDLYRRVFDAKNYHSANARMLGYALAEMIQFCFGGQIIKGVAKGIGKGVPVIKQVGKGARGAQGGGKYKVTVLESGVKEMNLGGMKVVGQFRTGTRLLGKTIQKTETRMGRNGKAVEIVFTDGSKIDINAVRVKQWELNLHPKAPTGALQKVKFPNPIVNSSGYKRLPTQEEFMERNIDLAIKSFSQFMNASWETVLPLLQDRDYTSDEGSIADWLQANWEFLIERKVLRIDQHLGIYSEGADFNGISSRITEIDSLPDFFIQVSGLSRGKTFDLLNNEQTVIDNANFIELVSFKNGFYYKEPPFNYVLLEDLVGIERVLEDGFTNESIINFTMKILSISNLIASLGWICSRTLISGHLAKDIAFDHEQGKERWGFGVGKKNKEDKFEIRRLVAVRCMAIGQGYFMEHVPFMSVNRGSWRYCYLAKVIVIISCYVGITPSLGVVPNPFYSHSFSDVVRQPPLPKYYDLIHTKLELKFDEANPHLHGIATLQVKPHFYTQQEIVLDVRNLAIRHVCIPGSSQQEKQLCDYVHRGHQLAVTLDRFYTQEEIVTLEIGYALCHRKEQMSVLAPIRGEGDGVMADGIPGKQGLQMWPQHGSDYLVDWFPTLDMPNQRCTQELYITVHDTLQTLSNGTLVYTALNEDQTRTDYWHMELPHPPHLFMLAIGQWKEVMAEWNDIPISYCTDMGTEPTEGVPPPLTDMLQYFSERWDYPYPWPKYSQLLIKGQQYTEVGGTTAMVLTEGMLSAAPGHPVGVEEMLAKAICRHWFGSLVSCESRSQRCFNEAFAALGVHAWYESTYGPQIRDRFIVRSVDCYVQEVQNKPLGAVIADGKDVMRSSDAIQYHKSVLIFHMLKNYLGEEAFVQSLNQYLKKHAFATADMHQVRKVFEEVSGQDLSWFFHQWFLVPGHPELKIEWGYQEGHLLLKIWQKQAAPSPIYQLPLAVDVWGKGSKERYHIMIDKAYQEIRWPMQEEPELVYVDKRYMLIGKLTLLQSLQSAMRLYEYGDDVWAKLEAIEQLKCQKAELAIWNNLMSKAIESDDWFLKTKILQQVGYYTVKDKAYPLWEAQLMELVQDANDCVREAALCCLGQGATPNKYVAVYKHALEDVSDRVIGIALSAYSQYQPDGPEKEAILLRFEPSEHLLIIKSLAAYYTRHKRADKYEWLKAKTRQLYQLPGYECLLEYLVDFVSEGGLRYREETLTLLQHILASNPPLRIASTASKGLQMLSKGKMVKEVVKKQVKTQKTTWSGNDVLK
eukprot:gene346-439_t